MSDEFMSSNDTNNEHVESTSASADYAPPEQSAPLEQSAPQQGNMPQQEGSQNSYAQPQYSQQNTYQGSYTQPQGMYQQQQYTQNSYSQPQYTQQNTYQQPYAQTQYTQQGGYQNPYQQQTYTQANGYQQPYYGQAVNQKGDGIGFGVASLVLGIASIFLFACCINNIMAILAIIFGIVQMVKNEKKGMAIGGIITAVISIILGVLFWVGVVAAADYTGDDSFDYYMEEYLNGDEL